MKKKFLAWLLCVVMVLTIAPMPTALAADFEEDVESFVLTNEGSSLMIDELEAAGCVTLYQGLIYLRNNMDASAPAALTDRMDALIAELNTHPGSEVFTASLHEFTGAGNSPVGINADGTFIRASFPVYLYHGQPGFATYEGNVKYTYPLDYEQDGIYMGSHEFDLGGGVTLERSYYAFGLAWSLGVAGTAADDTAILQIDNKTPSARDKTWELSVTSGTVKAGVAKADVTLAGLPAGLDYTAAKGTGNTIVITLTGAATTALTADATLTATIKGSAVTEADAQDSAAISLKLWYVGAGTTFVLTNEAGGLIDKLIDAGHGTKNLYQVMQLLQPYSNGAITDRFIQTLASNPAGNEVFTAALSNFSINYPACINADGTITIQPIYAGDYDGDAGYTTASSTYTGVGVVRFTTADSEDDYIPAGSATIPPFIGTYKAFAIAWMPEAPEATTFVLSNEEGGLIDQLIAAGYGNSNLYQALVSIAPSSGGVITEDFLETLALCDSGSQIFTQTLNSYAGLDGAVAINTDGTAFTTTSIKGRDYYGDTGYSTYPPDLSGAGREIFTYADSAGYYIDAPNGGTTYKVFAIGWSMALTVAGTATDDTAILQIDNKTPSARDKTWEINVTSGTVKTGVAKADVTLSGLPAGLDYTAAKGTGNTIVITLTGAATTALTADATVTATIKGSAVTEADAQDSAGISLKLWYVGPENSFVLTDAETDEFTQSLVDAGCTNLYDALVYLYNNFPPDAPAALSMRMDRLIKTIESCPANSEVFTDPLSAFIGVGNNPVCINADGTWMLAGFSIYDYHNNVGFNTYSGSVNYTYPEDFASSVFCGSSERNVGGAWIVCTYKAFAIAWMSTGGGGGDDPVAPTVVTNDASGITASGATLGGNVTASGGATVTERGFVYGSSANPAIGGAGVTKVIVGDGTGSFNTAISGLAASTPYHVRAYAINSAGTSYGLDKDFTTLTGGGGGGDPSPVAPTVVTNDASGITASGATLGGNVTASGGATVTERGFVYGSSANPAIGGAGVTKVIVGDGTGSFNTAISGLAASTPYHVRAYAINSAGTSYGTDKGFTTLAGTTPTTPPDDNDPDYIPRTLTDPATGITVSGSLIHKSAALAIGSMALHAERTCAACDAIRQRMADDDFLLLIGKDISLSYGFQGSLTITFPVGSAYNGDTVTILHCANGTLQTYTATVKDGKATFTVTSLSPFAVFAATDVLDNIPKTGDGGGFPLGLGLSALGVLGFCLLVLTRKRRRA
jgi:hypothetical protein